MVGSTHLPHGSQKQGGASVPPEPRQYPFIGQCCTNVTPGPGPPATSGKVTVGLRIPHPGLEPGLGGVWKGGGATHSSGRSTGTSSSSHRAGAEGLKTCLREGRQTP